MRPGSAHLHSPPRSLARAGKRYGRPVAPGTLMTTGGSSMATDIAARVHTEAGDIAVTEAPTYYLAHQMFRERGLKLREPVRSSLN